MRPIERKLILETLLELVKSTKPETRTPPRKGPTTARDFVEQPKIRQIRRMA